MSSLLTYIEVTANTKYNSFTLIIFSNRLLNMLWTMELQIKMGRVHLNMGRGGRVG